MINYVKNDPLIPNLSPGQNREKSMQMFLLVVMLIVFQMGVSAQGGLGHGRLTGYLKDETGHPVAGATLTLELGRSTKAKVTQSDSQGKWVFTGVGSGAFYLHVSQNGKQIQTFIVTCSQIKQNTPVTLVIKSKNTPIAGITDPNETTNGLLGLENSSSENELDMDKEGKTQVVMQIQLLEASPTKTMNKKSFRMAAKPGEKASVQMGSGSEFMQFSVVPTLKEELGIELKINWQILPTMDKAEEKSVTVRNFESLILDAFEDPVNKTKLIIKILPRLVTYNPAMPYPNEQIDMKFDQCNVILNKKTLLIRNFGVSGCSRDDLFFTLYHPEKGLYVLALKEFEGSKPLGVINDTRLAFEHQGDSYEFESRLPILQTPGKWLVWVLYLSEEQRSLAKKKNFPGSKQAYMAVFAGIGALKTILAAER